mgnify:CR=1 FL=1
MSDFIRAVWKIAHTARLLTRMHGLFAGSRGEIFNEG